MCGCCWSSWLTAHIICGRCHLSARKKKRQRIARETMDIFAPLAERIEMTSLQSELEDTAFEVLDAEMRQGIINRLRFHGVRVRNPCPDDRCGITVKA